MADEQENTIGNRMAAFASQHPASKRGGTPKFVIPALLLMSGALVGISGAAYLINRNKAVMETAPMPETSTASEFQGDGRAGLTAEDAPPAAVLVTQDNSAELGRLQSTITQLEQRLKELRDNPEVEVVTDEAALDALRAELTDIRTNLEAGQKAYDEQKLLLDARDRDLMRVQTELETERLLRDQGDDEARRLAGEEALRRVELERRRAEAEALLQRKINSPIVAYTASGGTVGGVDDAQVRYTGDEAFRRAGAEPVSVTQSEIIANPANTVVQGTLIEGTLETGILSDLAGNVAAIVSYDVYSFDMSQVLIPRGSKLYGRYSSDVGIGQKRILIAWDRIVTTDGQSVQISAFGGDRLGRSGLTGKVNNHFFERFGSAALISIIGALPELAAGQTNNETTQYITENVAEDFQGAVDNVLADYLSIPPTISVDQGAVVMVRVNNDLELF